MQVFKSIATNALLGLGPVARYAATKHVTGIDGDANRSRELFDWYQKQTDVRGKDVLELGTGKTLEVVRIAKREGARSVAAADVTRYHDQTAALRECIDYQIYDGRELPFADTTKDLVWAHYCMQHFRYPEVSARSIHRVLRPGGRLIGRRAVGRRARARVASDHRHRGTRAAAGVARRRGRRTAGHRAPGAVW